MRQKYTVERWWVLVLPVCSNINFKVCDELTIDRLECLTVEISKKPHALSFLVVT